MSNNYECWKHIGTAPKDREVLVWDGDYRHVAQFNGDEWVAGTSDIVFPTHWRGCPPPPYQSLPDDEE